MNDTCLGCYGSGRFGIVGGASEFASPGAVSRTCARCGGSGREPAEELRYVAEINRRVAERIARAA